MNEKHGISMHLREHLYCHSHTLSQRAPVNLTVGTFTDQTCMGEILGTGCQLTG